MAAPAIGIRRLWTPPVTSKVDTSHPLAGKLVSAWLPVPGYGARALHGGQHMGIQGAPTQGVTRFGRGMASTTGQYGARATTGTAGKLSIQPPLSIMWAGRFTAAPTANAHLFGCIYDLADGNPYYCYAIDVNAASQYRISANNAGTYFSVEPSYNPEIGLDVVLIATITPAATEFWHNGVRLISGSGLTTVNYGADSAASFNWYGASRATNTISNFGAIWNRELMAAEVAKLTADPFCFVRR